MTIPGASGRQASKRLGLPPSSSRGSSDCRRGNLPLCKQAAMSTMLSHTGTAVFRGEIRPGAT